MPTARAARVTLRVRVKAPRKASWRSGVQPSRRVLQDADRDSGRPIDQLGSQMGCNRTEKNSSFPRKREPSATKSTERSEAEILCQVPPVAIGGLDEFQLPRAVPFLDPLLSGDGGLHRRVLFKPYEQLDPVLLIKAVLSEAAEQVRSQCRGCRRPWTPEDRRRVGSLDAFCLFSWVPAFAGMTKSELASFPPPPC